MYGFLSPLRSRCWNLSNRYHRRFFCISNSPKRKWTSNKVRDAFVDYFRSSGGCTFVPSSSVIRVDDPSVLFVNAGMNQFKPIFLDSPPLDATDYRSRLTLVVNSQKCIRAGGKHNDLAEVGRDGTHHTFFEMLGNWGFDGHLSKYQACQQALNLLTDVYGLEKSRLFVTYFEGNEELGVPADSECKDVWRELGFNENRIVGLGAKDNFWEMSSLGGPCGPCSEILYSASDHAMDASKSVEIWNIVFMSYNKLPDGSLVRLPAMHVDTGMGLERLCSILQGVNTTYETDLFRPLLEEIEKRTGARTYAGVFGDEDVDGIDTAYRILADHARMFSIAIADGVAPAANKAGSVLRRIIRSAAYQASVLSSKTPRSRRRSKLNLADLADVVAVSLGDAYPELRRELGKIRDVVGQEQASFEILIRKSKQRLGSMLERANGSAVEASELFRFHHEIGLPLEVVSEMVKSKGVQFDEQELRRKVEQAREQSRKAEEKRQRQIM